MGTAAGHPASLPFAVTGSLFSTTCCSRIASRERLPGLSSSRHETPTFTKIAPERASTPPCYEVSARASEALAGDIAVGANGATVRRCVGCCRGTYSTPRADGIVEASRRKSRGRAAEQGRPRALGRALRLGTRLFLLWYLGDGFSGRPPRSQFGPSGGRRCHLGMSRLGCRRLRHGWLDRRLVVRHRRLILAVRSE
jgi:hypothetical protein